PVRCIPTGRRSGVEPSPTVVVGAAAPPALPPSPPTIARTASTPPTTITSNTASAPARRTMYRRRLTRRGRARGREVWPDGFTGFHPTGPTPASTGMGRSAPSGPTTLLSTVRGGALLPSGKLSRHRLEAAWRRERATPHH